MVEEKQEGGIFPPPPPPQGKIGLMPIDLVVENVIVLLFSVFPEFSCREMNLELVILYGITPFGSYTVTFIQA